MRQRVAPGPGLALAVEFAFARGRRELPLRERRPALRPVEAHGAGPRGGEGDWVEGEPRARARGFRFTPPRSRSGFAKCITCQLLVRFLEKFRFEVHRPCQEAEHLGVRL